MEREPRKPHIVGFVYEVPIAVLMNSIVTKMGYTFLVKSTSAEAIQHVNEADMVISDVSYGGYDVYNAARASKKPVIMIDGGLLELDRTPDAIIIPKPFMPSELEQAIRKCAEGLKSDKQQ